MCKRLWKNVILVMCCLALVLQPVKSFAAGLTYQTDDFNTFTNYFLNSNITGGTYYHVFSVETNQSQVQTINSLQIHYGLNGYDYFYVQLIGKNEQNQDQSGIWAIPYDLALCSQQYSPTKTVWFFNFDYYDYTCYCYNTTTNQFSTYTVVAGMDWYIWNGGGLIMMYQNQNITVKYTPDEADYDFLKYVYNDAHGGGGGSGSGGSGGSSIDYTDWFEDIMSFLAFNLHGYVHSANNGSGSIVNTNWVNIGQFLTYDYLCKTNKSSSTVTVTLLDGTSATLANYLYGNPDYTSDLSTMKSTLSTISSRINTTNTRLNTINTHLTNKLDPIKDAMDDVNNRLEMAFPDDQAEMNDHIADQILNDSNDTGLTVNRITSAKSDLDDGLSTFKLNTSGSQYSNPFSALDDADWSFWSQTTLDNLGSGYIYSFSEGSLMSEDDVFTENQNTLLDLLGW